MIDLNSLDVHSLPYESIDNKGLLPEIPSIYFAIDSNNIIQYIGCAKNTKQRWLGHHRYNQLSKISGVRIAYLHIDCIELLPEIETVLIEHFKPSLNNSEVCNDKKRVTVVLNQDLYEELAEIADSEARSLTSLVTYVLLQFINDRKNKS